MKCHSGEQARIGRHAVDDVELAGRSRQGEHGEDSVCKPSPEAAHSREQLGQRPEQRRARAGTARRHLTPATVGMVVGFRLQPQYRVSCSLHGAQAMLPVGRRGAARRRRICPFLCRCGACRAVVFRLALGREQRRRRSPRGLLHDAAAAANANAAVYRVAAAGGAPRCRPKTLSWRLGVLLQGGQLQLRVQVLQHLPAQIVVTEILHYRSRLGWTHWDALSS